MVRRFDYKLKFYELTILTLVWSSQGNLLLLSWLKKTTAPYQKVLHYSILLGARPN